MVKNLIKFNQIMLVFLVQMLVYHYKNKQQQCDMML
jgi:hypothetical protein